MARPGLPRHPKFRRLAALLGVPEAHARGYLECLWDVAYESGDALIGDATDVKLASGYPAASTEIVNALLECGGARAGFIEETEHGYSVHDLWDHAPDYVRRRRAREREREARGRELADCDRSTSGQRPVTDEPMVPTRAPAPAPALNTCAPSGARSTRIKPGDYDRTPDFNEFWRVYPRSENKKRAHGYWLQMSDEKRAAALEALPRHVDHWRRTGKDPQYIPHPSAWLNGARWEDKLSTSIPERDLEAEWVAEGLVGG